MVNSADTAILFRVAKWAVQGHDSKPENSQLIEKDFETKNAVFNFP